MAAQMQTSRSEFLVFGADSDSDDEDMQRLAMMAFADDSDEDTIGSCVTRNDARGVPITTCAHGRERCSRCFVDYTDFAASLYKKPYDFCIENNVL